jgi:hypothetical protein
MTAFDNEPSNLIDRSIKLLLRDRPAAVMRLAGMLIQPQAIRVEDPNLNLPELRADHVFIVDRGEPGRSYAVYLEYQLKPDPDLLPVWCIKWGGLTKQLGMPVLLLALYLEKGDRATFPAEHRTSADGLETRFAFDAVRLWEHRDRIVSGELAELAPLLVLCEERPTVETLRQEVALIHGSGLAHGVQAELLGVAFLVALRSFGRELVVSIFEGEKAMINEVEEAIRDLFGETTYFQKLKAEGREEGKAEGKAEGTQAVREMTLRFLVGRFGELPQALVQRIAAADTAWCQALFDRAIAAASLADLSLE